eukprot:COSAG02_NODE_53553_length_301_cov_0.673267_1_plen_92_part_10
MQKLESQLDVLRNSSVRDSLHQVSSGRDQTTSLTGEQHSDGRREVSSVFTMLESRRGATPEMTQGTPKKTTQRSDEIDRQEGQLQHDVKLLR